MIPGWREGCSQFLLDEPTAYAIRQELKNIKQGMVRVSGNAAHDVETLQEQNRISVNKITELLGMSLVAASP